MGSRDENDWVGELTGVDTAEEAILAALKESLASNTLPTFNNRLQCLVESDSHNTALYSTPLEFVPVLLSADHAVRDYPADLWRTLELVATYGNSKEILLVAQESLDTLVCLVREDAETEDETDDETEPRKALNPSLIVWKWIALIKMYNLAFPRLILRKRSAPETAGPIFEHLRGSFNILGHLAYPQLSRQDEIIDPCMRLGYTLLGWFEDVQATADDVARFKVVLQDCLFVSVSLCLSNHIISQENSNFVQRLVEARFDFAPPRLLDIPRPTLNHTMGRFVLHALANPDTKSPTDTQENLQAFLLGASTSLGHPQWHHIALRWLLKNIEELGEADILDSDFTANIVPSISSVAATSYDSDTRAKAFRLLTLVLFKVKSETAFEILRQIVDEECPYPNLRSSAVGLLRQLVVRALNRKTSTLGDPFANEILLQEYAPILFKSYVLEGTETTDIQLDDIQEINRITESLGLYYVLLSRDVSNLTGVRNSTFIKETEAKFVAPLRSRLAQSDISKPGLIGLLMSLERVEETLSQLKEH